MHVLESLLYLSGSLRTLWFGPSNQCNEVMICSTVATCSSATGLEDNDIFVSLRISADSSGVLRVFLRNRFLAFLVDWAVL